MNGEDSKEEQDMVNLPQKGPWEFIFSDWSDQRGDRHKYYPSREEAIQGALRYLDKYMIYREEAWGEVAYRDELTVSSGIVDLCDHVAKWELEIRPLRFSGQKYRKDGKS